MVIKIGKLKIDFESRASKHRAYLFNEIMALREEIVDLVLINIYINTSIITRIIIDS